MSSSRSFAACFSAVAVAVLVFATGAQAAPSVKLKTSSQSALASKGAKVAVSGKAGSSVKLVVKTQSFDEGMRNFAKPRTVRLGKNGRATVTVKPTSAARSAAGTCAARTLTATARSGEGRASDSVRMRRNRPGCRLAQVDVNRAADCDWIAQPNEGMCMMPFPNDYYTVKDASSPTGKRIRFTAGGMPRNDDNVPIDPAPYLASDGFSQGQSIVLKVPGIGTPEDIEKNGFVGLSDLGRYAEPGQRAVVIDARTGKRQPIWVDVDQTGDDPEQAALMISPATNFEPKRRYIVALRNLVDGSGEAIEAPNAFRYLRDAIPSGQNTVNRRRDHFEGIFKALRKAGVKRSDLYLAWDFTVASNQNNYRRALSMRDRAFAVLGDQTMGDQIVQGDAPQFEVTEVTEVNGPQIKRRIRGNFTVPCFLTEGCEPGGVMELDQNGLPERNGDYVANMTCIVPQIGLTGSNPPRLRPFVFGHGLVGTADGVTGSINPKLAQDHAMIACATDEIGMASEDIPTIFGSLAELSSFPVVPDRLQQGLINELYLARLMFHPEGLGTDPAFRTPDPNSRSVIRNDHVYYMGASQGGIMGGPLTALSPDFTKSALVVGAMNYSTLLTRSSNWKTYAIAFDVAYAEQLEKPLVLSLIQMLWDRGEPNGYAHVMTDDPPPNTPKHQVTLHVALGDHQVSNFASDVMARTVGMKTPAGGIDPRRWPFYEDLWNIPRIKPDEYPYRGSAIVYWDGGPFRKNPLNPNQNIGTGLPPYANVPPNTSWEDPHGAPRGADGPVKMINTLFDPNGYIMDLCGGDPCLGGGWDGNYDTVIAP